MNNAQAQKQDISVWDWDTILVGIFSFGVLAGMVAIVSNL